MLGQKFVYSHVTDDDRSSAIKQALDLLVKARLCHKITASSANGIPLGAQTKDKFFKVILLDVGLVSALQDLRLTKRMQLQAIKLANQGGISEQFVGQSLRCLEPFYIDPSLYYWTRQHKGGSSEIDYMLQHNNEIIPIEVKSGSTGSLKSLHVFMAQKKLERAIRINADLPSIVTVDMQTPTRQTAHYQLLSLPLYMVGQLHRLLNDTE
jgi:predicted AAA+ superfamily ATPase